MKRTANSNPQSSEKNFKKTYFLLFLLSLFLSFGAAGLMLLNELSIL